MAKRVPAWGLFRLLKALEKKRFGGHLALTVQEGAVSVGFDDGRILRIDTAVKDWSFPAYLLRARILTDPVRAERMVSSTMLVEAKVVRPEDAARLRASYLRSVLTSMMPETFSAWEVDRTPVPESPVPDLPVDPEPELMRAVARAPLDEMRTVVDRLRASGDLALDGDVGPCLRHARVQFGDSDFVQALRDRDVSVITEEALGDESVVRILFALHVAGVLAVHAAPPPAPPMRPLEALAEEPPAPIIQSDVEAGLLEAATAMADQNDYELLGVSIDARPSAVRSAWRRLRRQFARSRYEGLVTPQAMAVLEGIHERVDHARDRLLDRDARMQYNRAIEVATPSLEARLVEVFDARQLHLAGLEALEGRDAKGAMSHFEAALRQDPQEPDFLVGMANALLAMPASGDVHAQAKGVLDQALAMDDNLLEAHLAMAELLRRIGQGDAAMEQVRRVLALDPENEEAGRLRERLRKRAAMPRSGSFAKPQASLIDRIKSLLRRDS